MDKKEELQQEKVDKVSGGLPENDEIENDELKIDGAFKKTDQKFSATE